MRLIAALLTLISFLTSHLLSSSQGVVLATQTNCKITTDPPFLVQDVAPLSSRNPGSVFFKIYPTDKKDSTYKVVFREGFLRVGEIGFDHLSPRASDGALVDSKGDLPSLFFETRGVNPGAEVLAPGNRTLYVERKGVPGRYCHGVYTIHANTSGGITACQLNFNPSNPNSESTMQVTGTVLPSGTYRLNVGPRQVGFTSDRDGHVNFPLDKLNPGTYTAVVERAQGEASVEFGTQYSPTNCIYLMRVAPAGQSGSITQIGHPGPPTPPPHPEGNLARRCEGEKCSSAGGTLCGGDNVKNPGIQTAIGCIHTIPKEFVKDFMRLGVGIGGGVVFLLIILGVFRMLTSAGNPQSLKEGQDILTSAVIGLLLVIFATLLLKIIGVDILNIPGFT